jgi:hypothetical protein
MNSSIELLPVGLVLGLFVLLIVPAFALIALLVVALAAIPALLALTAAVVATPYLLGHSLVQHLRARRSARRHQALPVAAGRRLLAPTGDPGWRTG